MPSSDRRALLRESIAELEPLVEAYYAVSDAERILIEDTLTISQPSIHRSNLDATIPSLLFPDASARKSYADLLCDVLNRRARKHGIKTRAYGQVSKSLNLILLTVIFGDAHGPYEEKVGDAELWQSLDRINAAAKHGNRSFQLSSRL